LSFGNRRKPAVSSPAAPLSHEVKQPERPKLRDIMGPGLCVDGVDTLEAALRIIKTAPTPKAGDLNTLATAHAVNTVSAMTHHRLANHTTALAAAIMASSLD
jgi:hypothetical protein